MANEWMPIHEAAFRLGVSKTKIAQLVRDGVLPFEQGKLDKRVKLVRREDVERIALQPRGKGRVTR